LKIENKDEEATEIIIIIGVVIVALFVAFITG